MSHNDVQNDLKQQERASRLLGAVKSIRERIEAAASTSADVRRLASDSLAQAAELESQLSSGTMPTGDLEQASRMVIALGNFASAAEQAVGMAGATQSAGDATQFAERAHVQAASFMRDLRQYDGLLQFGSDSERAAYEQREAERRRRYEEESAKGTPEGKFNASGEALGQMAEVAAHGGSADPALMQRMDELADSLTALRAQFLREGKTTEVETFDQQRRSDLRAIMQSKGLSDAQIDAFLAAHPDPIEATRKFVTEHAAAVTVKDLDRLDNGAYDAKQDSSPVIANAVTEQSSPRSPLSPADDIGSAVADLKAMGLVLTQYDDDPAHGIDAGGTSAAGRSTVRT